MVKSVFEIQEEWAKDSIVDETSVGPELLKLSKLQSKYTGYLAENSLISKKKLIEYNKMRAVKWDYYNGNMSKEELDERGWKPYLYTVKLKEGIERCLDRDEDLNNMLMNKVLYDEAVSLCESILKAINNRGYSLKAWVDYQKYILGHS